MAAGRPPPHSVSHMRRPSRSAPPRGFGPDQRRPSAAEAKRRSTGGAEAPPCGQRRVVLPLPRGSGPNPRRPSAVEVERRPLHAASDTRIRPIPASPRQIRDRLGRRCVEGLAGGGRRTDLRWARRARDGLGGHVTGFPFFYYFFI